MKKIFLCLLLAAALLVQSVALSVRAEETGESSAAPTEEVPSPTEVTGGGEEVPDVTQPTEEETEAPTEPTEEPEFPTEEPTEPEEPTQAESTEPEEADDRFFPDFIQDYYEDVLYGSGTVKNNGSSICCLAVAATYLTKHWYFPDELAGWFGASAENNLDRFRYAVQALQLPMTPAENYDQVKQALLDGKIVIQVMNGNSLFTNFQQFILLKGYTSDGKILVYDPSLSNRSNWRLKEGFQTGFSTEELCWGYSGAFIFDPAAMPEYPFIYYGSSHQDEHRYGDLTLTEAETDLLARLVWVEARGESADGQQAVAEVVLNRLYSGEFGSSLTALIHDQGQFVPKKLLNEAQPWQAQYEAIDRALHGPYLLPMNVYYYGRSANTDSVWGTIGEHVFCYAHGYSADANSAS